MAVETTKMAPQMAVGKFVAMSQNPLPREDAEFTIVKLFIAPLRPKTIHSRQP